MVSMNRHYRYSIVSYKLYSTALMFNRPNAWCSANLVPLVNCGRDWLWRV